MKYGQLLIAWSIDNGLFFVDEILLSLILAKVHSQKYITLVTTSSGIAATLMYGGRSAHSALKLQHNTYSAYNMVLYFETIFIF